MSSMPKITENGDNSLIVIKILDEVLVLNIYKSSSSQHNSDWTTVTFH